MSTYVDTEGMMRAAVVMREAAENMERAVERLEQVVQRFDASVERLVLEGPSHAETATVSLRQQHTTR